MACPRWTSGRCRRVQVDIDVPMACLWWTSACLSVCPGGHQRAYVVLKVDIGMLKWTSACPGTCLRTRWACLRVDNGVSTGCRLVA
jgi:hypothetical protein